MMTMVSSGNTARIEVYAQRLRRDSNAKRTMVVTMSLPNSDAGAWEPTPFLRAIHPPGVEGCWLLDSMTPDETPEETASAP